MQFTIKVNVNVERTEGKFATRDEIEAQIVEAIESADPGTFEGENGGQYEVNDWSVEAEQ